MNRAFLDPPLLPDNLDLYVVRSGILRMLKQELPDFSGRFLDVGAGNQPYKGLLTSPPSQIEEYVPLDLKDNLHYQDAEHTWDGVTMPFGNVACFSLRCHSCGRCTTPLTMNTVTLLGRWNGI